MGTGRKKIEIKKIEKQTARMVTSSKRRKGLFKKAQQFQSMMTGSKIAIVVFSPAGNPYTFGDVDSINAALQSCLKLKKGCCSSTTASPPGFCGEFEGASSSQNNCTHNETNMFGGSEFESARCSAEFAKKGCCSSTTAAPLGICGEFEGASSSQNNCTHNEINMFGGSGFESARCSAEFGPLIPCSV